MGLVGMGDYEVERNSILVPSDADRVPLMHGDQGVIRVRHREYLKDILSNSRFTNNPITIQPSNYACFPWLSTYAPSFEQYRLLGCVFEFKSLSGAISTSQALGSVTLATQYNVGVNSFATKSQALNHHFGCSTVPSSDLMHAVECKEMYDPYKLYWIRVEDAAPGIFDVRLDDYGVLNVIVAGCPTDGQALGELWVTYDVLLMKPRLQTRDQVVTVIDPPPIGPDPSVTEIHIPEWAPIPCCHEEQKF